MIIGIDGDVANVKKRAGGVHQTSTEILWGLYKLEDTQKNGDRYIIYLRSQPENGLPPENKWWKYKILPGGSLWILRKLMPELIMHPEPDVFFGLTHYLPPLSRIPMIPLITDLGYLEFSGHFRKYDYWQLKYWTAISLIISKYIIAISEATKKDIVRRYPFAKNKTSVVYLAANKVLKTSKIRQNDIQKILNKYRITKSYVLFMSTLKPGKNVEGLIDAFSEVRKKHDYQLVIAGKKGWLFEEIFKKVKKYGLENDVVFTDFLPDEEKPCLFKGAKVFVLPSFWEGFGIDVLNAMEAGVPVVVSKSGSLPEVAGEAGIYVDPEKPESIASGIEKVLKMSLSEYNKQLNSGYLQAEKFSWEKTAEQIYNIIKKVGSKNN